MKAFNSKALKKNEEGAVAVLVALTLTVLCGFSALAIDYGMLASSKQDMQNAADAAALAAAAELASGSYLDVYSVAKDFCELNNYNPDDENVRLEVVSAGKSVQVTVYQEMKAGFSSVLTGRDTLDVSATAEAEMVSIFGNCPYAMFASQRIENGGYGITINGNNIFINGNIHSNSDILMRNAVLGEGVVATAVRSVLPNTEGWKGNQIALDMPSLPALENALSDRPDIAEFPRTIVKDSHSGFGELVSEAIAKYHQKMGPGNGYRTDGLFIHVRGDLIFNGNTNTPYHASFPIILIVDGSINLNGMPLDSSQDNPMIIVSKNGMITVNGGGACYTGILYAPNGLVQINGNDAEFVGSIIAQNILKNGGSITVQYLENTDRFLPTTKVHLIE